MFSRLTAITAEGAHTCCTKSSKRKWGYSQSWQRCQQKIPNALKILLLSYSWLPTVQQLQRRRNREPSIVYSFDRNDFREKCWKEETTRNILPSPLFEKANIKAICKHQVSVPAERPVITEQHRLYCFLAGTRTGV